MTPTIPPRQVIPSIPPSKRQLRVVRLDEAHKPVRSTRPRNQTDLGNAERLKDQHGRDLRYCAPWKKWLIWDGQRSRADDTNEVISHASATARSIYAEATSQADPEHRKALSKFAARSEGAKSIENMVTLELGGLLPDDDRRRAELRDRGYSGCAAIGQLPSDLSQPRACRDLPALDSAGIRYALGGLRPGRKTLSPYATGFRTRFFSCRGGQPN